MIVVDQERDAPGSQTRRQIIEQVSLTGATGEETVDDGMRSGEHLEGMGGGEENVIRPSVGDSLDEPLQVERLDGFPER
jgi:hypothetical protein